MNVAHVMVLTAAVLPYVTVGGAKSKKGYDNAAPRQFLGSLEGWRARALWAHENGFEAFPAFAAAVILAELAHVPHGRVDALATAFIGLRLAYIAAYLGNAASIRTLLWGLGFVCVIWLFVLSI